MDYVHGAIFSSPTVPQSTDDDHGLVPFCPRRTTCSHHLQAVWNWAAHALIRNPIPIKAASSDTIRSGMRSGRYPCDDVKMQNTERKKYPNAIACFCITFGSVAEPTAWCGDFLSSIEQPAWNRRRVHVLILFPPFVSRKSAWREGQS